MKKLIIKSQIFQHFLKWDLREFAVQVLFGFICIKVAVSVHIDFLSHLYIIFNFAHKIFHIASKNKKISQSSLLFHISNIIILYLFQLLQFPPSLFLPLTPLSIELSDNNLQNITIQKETQNTTSGLSSASIPSKMSLLTLETVKSKLTLNNQKITFRIPLNSVSDINIISKMGCCNYFIIRVPI